MYIRSIFECIFEPTWLGFWLQKSKKNRKMTIPRGIDFWIDFLSILAPFWEPAWSDVGHPFRPKTAQDEPRGQASGDTWWALVALKTPPEVLDGPLSPQDKVPDGPGGSKAPFFLDFCFNFGPILDLFSGQARWRTRRAAALWIYV